MSKATPVLVASFLSLVGCDSSEQDSSFGSGTLGLTNAPQAFAGWEDEEMRFVVIPVFDWAAGNEIRTGSDGDVTTGGKGREWWGRVAQESGDQWDYRVGRESVRFGKQEFELSEGEVFVLEEGFRVVQLEGSKAGSIGDDENKMRLSQLLSDHQSKQGGVEIGDEYKTLIPEDLYNENRFRRAIHELEPELDAVSYLFDGHIVLALFRKGESDRYLLVLSPSPVGKVRIFIGGNEVPLPLRTPMVVPVATPVHHADGSITHDYDQTTDATIGHWITVPGDSKLTINGTLTHPAHRVLELAFQPPRTIKTTLVPVRDESEQDSGGEP